jgi:hypothetical protein
VRASAALSAWEAAVDVRGHARALALLPPEADGQDGVSLGTRDAALLRLYRDLRGPQLDALAECPVCGTTLEVHLAIDDLVDGYPARHGAAGTRSIDLGTAVAEVRLPTTEDLMAAAEEDQPRLAREILIGRCVGPVRRHAGASDSVRDSAALTEEELALLGARLEELDPLVDVRVDIHCEECGTAWDALLDVPELVWDQVRGVARRLLREVDSLATRYGWSESEILALSERRRRAYLDLT